MKKIILALLLLSIGNELNAQLWKDRYDAVAYARSQTIYYVNKNNKWGACDADGNVLVEPMHEDIFLINMKRNYFLIKNNGAWGIFDLKGQQIVAPSYNGIKIRDSENNYYGYFALLKDDKWVILDSNCRTLTPPAWYISLSYAPKGYFLICEVNKFSVYDSNGNKIVTGDDGYNLSGIQYGYLGFMNNKKWGVCDTSGRIIIEPTYNEIDFSVINFGYIKVRTNEKWGVCNTQGRTIISPAYDDYVFNNFVDKGCIAVKNDGKFGLCDISGKKIISPTYDDLSVHVFFDFGYIAVKDNGKWGIISKEGQQVVPCGFKDVRILNNGIIQVKIESQWVDYGKNSLSLANSEIENNNLYRKYYNEGESFFEKQEWKKSLKNYKLAATYKETFDVNYNIAACLYNSKNYKEAIQYFARSIDYAQSQNEIDLARENIAKSERAYQNQVQRRQEVGTAVVGALLNVAGAALSGGIGVSNGDSEYQAWMQYRQSGLPGAATISFEDFKRANARAAANGYQIGNGNSNSSSSSNNNSSSRKTCHYCNGKGTVVDNNSSVPTFGLSGTKYCEECKKDVPLSHCHVQCPVCKGKGYE